MTRWKASGLHLIISIIVLSSIAGYILYFWYPPALFKMARADRLLILIVSIDLIVGPLLTLIIYKAGKKYLTLDLAVIAIAQAAFLGYGLQTIYQSRPVFLVAVADRFELVFANEISDERLKQAKQARYQHLGFMKPVLVGALMPSDLKESDAVLDSALSGRGDIQTMPRYYVDYKLILPSLMKHAKPIALSKGMNQTQLALLKNAAASYGKEANDVRYLTLASTRGFATMLIDNTSGEPLGAVAWEED